MSCQELRAPAAKKNYHIIFKLIRGVQKPALVSVSRKLRLSNISSISSWYFFLVGRDLVPKASSDDKTKCIEKKTHTH